MTAAERREQLIAVARTLFAERGFEGTAIEEVAARATVSKPIVYEHFGGKEGLYAVVVDREVQSLLAIMRASLTGETSRIILEQAALALLQYVEENSEGFQILVRDSPSGAPTFQSILGDVASRVEGLLSETFSRTGLNTKHAPMYAQMLVGMVSFTGQWWLDTRKPAREVVAAHVVNMAWNGLSGLDADPVLFSAEPTAAADPA
ncbi:TetR/AcrR family transcriptional regulator [Nocardioides piscis]|uniref:TetR/AcrR family transcriptional regulator n=1 Tax=Nocardioides piscis TaxID=2714938 RepID=A0A6G7YKC4_9ACTN|nr:TetR/AcrR family transcriptional regulator [Nocardioides piscis]